MHDPAALKLLLPDVGAAAPLARPAFTQRVQVSLPFASLVWVALARVGERHEHDRSPVARPGHRGAGLEQSSARSRAEGPYRASFRAIGRGRLGTRPLPTRAQLEQTP